jgi:hypothetical protein
MATAALAGVLTRPARRRSCRRQCRAAAASSIAACCLAAAARYQGLSLVHFSLNSSAFCGIRVQ